MALAKSNSLSTRAIQPISSDTSGKKDYGVVYDVILNDDMDIALQYDRQVSMVIGAIRFRLINNLSSSDLFLAFPRNPNFKSMPLRNEYVEIYYGGSGVYYYQRINDYISPNISNRPENIDRTYKINSAVKRGDSASYSSVSRTGITRVSDNPGDTVIGYGEYYEPELKIHKLRLYEGDTLIESRFGQSIRFSAYNNPDTSFSPTIIIRNRESDSTRNLDPFLSTEENVNEDGSIILLGSGDYRLNFIPGDSTLRNGSGFDTTPATFNDYPTDLTGDQILINSGRVIISSKTGELIFYSKKNYGFISDGSLSIDNRLGIDISVGGDININSPDRTINLNTDNGKINLGNRSLEPLVKGDKLIKLLDELIDAITKQIYATPAGPTSTGPTNLPVFLKIKSQLRTVLSQYNKTS